MNHEQEKLGIMGRELENIDLTVSQRNNPQISQIHADFSKRDKLTYAIIGAAMKVHRELEHGFLKESASSLICVNLRNLRTKLRAQRNEP